jgi:uncharacterized sulfatase
MPERPNILWIMCEDLGPILGCYGDGYAYTPHLDKLAASGTRFTNAFSTSSVCAPARSCLITGIHACALGTIHLRGIVPAPQKAGCFTELLRGAGYYCSNNHKQDYNFVPSVNAWDDSSSHGHWRNRRPGQPFFSVFNLSETHEGQIRYSRDQFDKITVALPARARHDPESAPLRPYYPDTDLVRLNIAELYTQATLMDQHAGKLLAELRADGLDKHTIVFFFSDHGTGLPGCKRSLRDSGTRVPLIVRFPRRLRHLATFLPGGAVDRLISFEDFAPTVLRLAAIDPPPNLTGRSFLDLEARRERSFVYCGIDRVDEAIDCTRSVRDRRFLYIRNFLPHRPRLQHSYYSSQGLIERELRRLADAGALQGAAGKLMRSRKPAEEFYDTASDRDQIENLAGHKHYRDLKRRFAAALRRWMLTSRDTGLLPEHYMAQLSASASPLDLPLDAWPVERVLDAASIVGQRSTPLADLRTLLHDREAAVRYWALVGFSALRGCHEDPERLRPYLNDPVPSVRIACAEAMASAG